MQKSHADDDHISKSDSYNKADRKRKDPVPADQSQIADSIQRQYALTLPQAFQKPFFEHAMKVISKRGRESAQYAYLLGVICHFVLDSECHPYVTKMVKETGVRHLEMEEEFEKYLLKKDRQDSIQRQYALTLPQAFQKPFPQNDRAHISQA